MEDVRELLKAWVAADVKAVAAEKKVTEMQLSGERPTEEMVLQAMKLRADACTAKENVVRLVAE